jgi:hypothetical protein
MVSVKKDDKKKSNLLGSVLLRQGSARHLVRMGFLGCLQCQGKCIEWKKKSWENFPLNIWKFVGRKSQI